VAKEAAAKAVVAKEAAPVAVEWAGAAAGTWKGVEEVELGTVAVVGAGEGVE